MKTSAKLFLFGVLALTAACGGGGGGGGSIPPGGGGGGGATPTPTTTATPVVTPTPVGNLQAGTPTPIPVPTPLAQNTEAPPSTHTILPNSWGRIAPVQVFDYFPTTKAAMSNPQIVTDAHAYPMVWGSFNPGPWASGNPSSLTSQYYVPPEDASTLSGHDVAWFQANHPDWILYACNSSGNPINPDGTPTTQLAYVPGIGFPDVPLDISNPAVIDYQMNTSLIPYLQANNYKAAAFDQINFNNITVGGNPELKQSIIPGYYGCGVYQNGTFVKHYQSKQDPKYGQDMIAWIQSASATLHSKGFKVFVNHTVQNQSDPNENALLNYTDVELDETGYSDYGFYVKPGDSGLFGATVSWQKWLQSHNVASVVIDKFEANKETAVTPNELEYSIGTYLMANEGAAYLFTNPANGPNYGYGTEQWHNEFYAPIGVPCGEMKHDSNNTAIYTRQFSGGFVAVNAGSLPLASENATLPVNHTYTDIEGRAVTNPLPVASNDAYVLLTPVGTNNGCL